jgi:transcriptional regulator with XRE-family HTH domain
MVTPRRHDVPEHRPSSLGLALTYLRTAAGWSKTRLAQAVGLADESLITAYEKGAKPLTRERLDSLLESLGYPQEAVDVLLLAYDLIFSEPQAETFSPVNLSMEERRVFERAAMAACWTAGRIAARELRVELIRRRKEEKTEAARREAEGLFRKLMAVTRWERSCLVETFPEYWSWALAVQICEASVKSAVHKAGEALELAELALSIAERVAGEGSWRRRLESYCSAHIANALRVGNDYAEAETTLARAWELWRLGTDSDPELVPEWVLPSIEASLRMDQRRFSEALSSLDRARHSGGGTSHEALTFLLLQKEHIFNLMGDINGALSALIEAAPFVEASGDRRLLFVLRFSMSDNLCHLEKYSEAAVLLPEVRELAIQQANELDLIRVMWLAAKVDAGQGRSDEAVAGLEQVRRDFTVRELPYDAALSSLDLAVLWLQAGRTAEVKELAVAMGWIFKAKGIQREALAALGLFYEAALQEAATEELARRVIAELRRLTASPC